MNKICRILLVVFFCGFSLSGWSQEEVQDSIRVSISHKWLNERVCEVYFTFENHTRQVLCIWPLHNMMESGMDMFWDALEEFQSENAAYASYCLKDRDGNVIRSVSHHVLMTKIMLLGKPYVIYPMEVLLPKNEAEAVSKTAALSSTASYIDFDAPDAYSIDLDLYVKLYKAGGYYSTEDNKLHSFNRAMDRTDSIPYYEKKISKILILR